VASRSTWSATDDCRLLEEGDMHLPCWQAASAEDTSADCLELLLSEISNPTLFAIYSHMELRDN